MALFDLGRFLDICAEEGQKETLSQLQHFGAQKSFYVFPESYRYRASYHLNDRDYRDLNEIGSDMLQELCVENARSIEQKMLSNVASTHKMNQILSRNCLDIILDTANKFQCATIIADGFYLELIYKFLTDELNMGNPFQEQQRGLGRHVLIENSWTQTGGQVDHICILPTRITYNYRYGIRGEQHMNMASLERVCGFVTDITISVPEVVLRII